ncbi:A disintegrin and metalloproteinase with thrombospondin motifs 7 [Tetrabaena socialis]|uniref:A disintegrin and metalloproteinase with thrombospondin motifs 7 n=1 Tax=Tetrabaena socialis TaxID=47790 RepID=A0A2J8AFY1_9CHLO|nr:A disintegrin and metalloproteinase with thrombospondin motifs 7 [Tetrabaena socialis]|eukprot:PNH11434.1 A disintegrin and metalloproteinase with thrombospondin motifs 7 [Tetrabaena socialis]
MHSKQRSRGWCPATAPQRPALPAPLLALLQFAICNFRLLLLLAALPGGSLQPQGPDPLVLAQVPPTVLGGAPAPIVYGDRSRGWYAVELLPAGGIALAPDSFQTAYDLAGLPRDCDERTVLSGSISTFALPLGSRNFSLVALLGLPRRDLSAPGGAIGDVLSLGGLRVQWDAAAGALQLTAGWDVAATLSVAVGRPAVTQLRFPTAFAVSAAPPIALGISRRDDGALAVCVDGSPAKLLRAPSAVSPLGGGWLAGSSLAAGWSLDGADALQLGDPRATTSVSARLHQAWLVTGAAWSCADMASLMPSAMSYGNVTLGAPLLAAPVLAAPPYVNQPPRLARMELSVSGGGTGAEGEAFVGQDVTVAGEVTDADGDALRVQLTWYGVPARGCATSGCGNEVFTAQGDGSALVSDTASYQMPGRYTVRLEATDLAGLVVAWDAHVLVRKLGDTQRRAACCRSTGMVVAGQAGRPLHSTRFRDPAVSGLALGLGWPADNLAAEDLEAERLFDYGVLAPAHNPGGLQLTTCLDAYLAGPGSPRVLSGSQDQARVTGGHGKRMLIVPQGFDWGAAAAEKNKSEAPACESHWTKWPTGSPYRRSTGTLPDGTPSYCSYACTRNGTQTLRQLTGMTDRLAEAIAELSYGRLSYSWDVTVTDTLPMPMNTSADAFFYSDLPVTPFLQRQGLSRAAFHTVMMLSPAPPARINSGFTAWSAVGAASMFVMRCAPQLYYLVHEVGHLLGLPHANIWSLQQQADGLLAQAEQMEEDAWRLQTESQAMQGDADRANAHAAASSSLVEQVSSSSWVWRSGAAGSHQYDPTVVISSAHRQSATALQLHRAATLKLYDASQKQAAAAEQQAALAKVEMDLADLEAQGPGSGGQGPDSLATAMINLARAKQNASQLRTNLRAVQQEMEQDRSAATVSSRGAVKADENLEHMEQQVQDLQQQGGVGWKAGRRSHRGEGRRIARPAEAGAMLRGGSSGEAWRKVDRQAHECPASGALRTAAGNSASPPARTASHKNAYHRPPHPVPYRRIGKLPVRIRVAGAGSGLPLDLRGSCGFPLLPRLQLHLGPPYDTATLRTTAAAAAAAGGNGTAREGDAARAASAAGASGGDGGLPAGIASVVWRNPMNVTFASGTMAATLPPFSDRWVREASAVDSPPCASGCDATYRVRLAAYDGAQVLVSVRVTEVSLSYILLHVSYRHYLPDEITTESELLFVPVLPPWAPRALPSSAGAPAAGAQPGSSGASGGVAAAQRVSDGPLMDAAVQAAAAGASAQGAWPPTAAGPGDGAWGLQLLGDLYGSRAAVEQPAAKWSAPQLPASGCSGQWSLTLLLKMAPPDRDGRWPVASVSLAPGDGAGPSGSSSGGGAPPQLGVWLVRNTSIAFATSKGSGSTTSPLALSLIMGSQQEALISMPAPDATQRVYHVALVYDQGRLGAWVDGSGAWHWRDAACSPARAGVTYCSGTAASARAAGDTDGDASLAAGLGAISLLGSGPGLGALLLSARAYNYALPRADFGAEATCLGDGTCAARFGLRAAPPPVAGEAPVGGSAGAAAAVAGVGVPGGTASIPVPDEPGWDLLAAAAASAAAALNASIPGPAGYSLQVGNWSDCSTSCGGGAAMRVVMCYRSTPMGPWPVSRDDCPLAGLPSSVAPCHQQPCPPSAALLAPTPGPSACLEAQLQAACNTGQEKQQQQQARQLLQPICLRADGLQLPLGSCAAAQPRPDDPSPAAAVDGPELSAEGTPGSLLPLAGAFDAAMGVAAWEAIDLRGVLVAGRGPEGGPAAQLELTSPGGSNSSGGGSDAATISLRRALASGALRPLCPAAATAPIPCSSGSGGGRTRNSSGNGSTAGSLAAAEAPALRWTLGPWGPCSSQCGGGGTRARAAACIDATIGAAPLEAAACEQALGPVPPALLSGPCGGGQPCSAARWRVGPWSQCVVASSDSLLRLGTTRRSLECVDAAGAPIAPVFCAGLGPAATTKAEAGAGAGGLNSTSGEERTDGASLLASALAASAASAAGSGGRYAPAVAADCWEAAPFAGRCMLPRMAASERPCFGNGACTYAGCVCNPGFAGQLCEVPLADSPESGAATPASVTIRGCASGVLDRRGLCCGTGLLSTNGTCCSAAADAPASTVLSLDASGGCCARPVDACGVCGGSGVAVDVQGLCCATRLDQHGLCCASGLTDECGVCDGDGTSCALRLQLRVQLRPGAANAPGAAVSLDSAALSRLLRLGVGPSSEALELSLLEVAGPVVTGAAAWLLATYDITYGGAAESTASVGVAAVGAGGPDPWDGPSTLPPLGPYTFSTTAVGLRLRGLGAALLALNATVLSPGSSGSQLASSRASGAHRRSVAGAQAADSDAVEGEVEGGSGGGGGVFGLLHAGGDAVAMAVQAAGAAVAAVRQAVWPRRGLGTPPYDDPYGSTARTVEPEPTTSTDAFQLRHQPGSREPHADGFGESSFGSDGRTMAGALGDAEGSESEQLGGRRRQTLAVAGRIQQGQAAISGAAGNAVLLPLAAPSALGVQAGRRRRLHEAAHPLLSALPTNSGIAPLQAAPGRPPRRARARNHTHVLAQSQLFQLSAALQEHWQPQSVLSGATSQRRRAQQQQQAQAQAQPLRPAASLPSAPAPTGIRILIAGAPPAGTAAAAAAAGTAATATPEQQAAALALAGSPDALRAVASLGLLGLEVVGMERLGLCGNGVCEVGEQAGVAGAAGCPQDCPAALRPAACPAGSSLGVRDGFGGGGMRSCSGRGACLTGPGACACHQGYTGDACDGCSPGFWRAAAGVAAGACIRQYIRGRTLPEWDALGPSPSRGLLSSKLALICIIVGSGTVSALVLASLAAFVWRSGLLRTKASVAVAPAGMAASPGRAATASKKKDRRSSRVAPTPHAASPAAAPWSWSLLRQQQPGAAGGGGAAAAAMMAAAVTPPRRALVRVMAAGDVEELLQLGSGLQVLSLSHPTPGSTITALSGAEQAAPSPPTSRQATRSLAPSPSQDQKQQGQQQQEQPGQERLSVSSQAPILSRMGSAQTSQTRRAWAQNAAVAAAVGAAEGEAAQGAKGAGEGGGSPPRSQPPAGPPSGVPALLRRPLAWLTGTLRDARSSTRSSLVTAAPQPGTPAPLGAGSPPAPQQQQMPDRSSAGGGSRRQGGGGPTREGVEDGLPGLVPEEDELGPEVEVLLYTVDSPRSPPQTPCRRRVTANSSSARRTTSGGQPLATWQAAAEAAVLPASPGADKSPPPPPRTSRLSSGGGRSPRSPRVLMPALSGAAAATAAAGAPSPAGSDSSAASSTTSGAAAGPWWHLTPLTPPWQLFHTAALDPAKARAGGAAAGAGRGEPRGPSRAAAAAAAYGAARAAEQGPRRPPAAGVAELVSPTRARRCASDGAAAGAAAAVGQQRQAAARQEAAVGRQAAARQEAAVGQQAAARQAAAEVEGRGARGSSGSSSSAVSGGGGGAGPAAGAQHQHPQPPQLPQQQPHRSPTGTRPVPGLSAAAAAAILASPRVTALRGQGAGQGGDAADVVKSPRRALLMPHPRAATPCDT